MDRLDRLGISVEDSEEGILANVIRVQPDLVLMDVNLRKASGLKVLERIREREDCADIRILMSSGMDYRIECKQAGANDFLQKPYMPDDLVEALRRVMNRQTEN